jgi:MerR family transcriptional regulator, thiopeptide resistance regulator
MAHSYPEAHPLGYRLYSEDDLERLYQILLYRELGFSLEAIGQLIDGAALARGSALRAQRDLLAEGRRRTDAVIRAVDRLLESMETEEKMSSEEIMDGFDAFANAPDGVRAHQEKYGREAKERWGETDTYRESMRRSRSYAKGDRARIQEEGERTESRMAELLSIGADPEGAEAKAGAEAMRQHITRWFYPCSYAMHAGLADMYEADLRFTAHYEKRARGLAAFVAQAIRANAMSAWDEGRE